MAMKEANIGELKNNLSHYIALVEDGEEIEVSRRNRPVARIVAVKKSPINRTQLGCGCNSVTFHVEDLTEPFIDHDAWDMHR